MTAGPSADRLARIALSRVAEPGTWSVHDAIVVHGAAEVWAAVREGRALDEVKGRCLAGLRERAGSYDPLRDVATLTALSARVICPGDEEWPEGLTWEPGVLGGSVRDMAPPWLLCARGAADLRAATAPSVAVVGARAASPYGVHVATDLGFALSEAGVGVVSGLAYGIDAAAHRGALTARAAPTVAVLACGVDVAYPRGHDRLLEQVAREGVVLSEVLPGSAPTRVRFLVRNRIIAALTAGTVVVEASHRSGSLSTAGRAFELGRQVMAVPGPVTSAASAGCHHLLREQEATLVTCVPEVLELIGRSGENLLTPQRGPIDPRDGLSADVRQVLDAVPVRSPVGLARIARTAGVAAPIVQSALARLHVLGLVEQHETGWRLSGLGAGRGVRSA